MAPEETTGTDCTRRQSTVLPEIDLSSWSFEVWGQVLDEYSWDREAWTALPRTRIEAPGGALYTGVSARELLSRIRVESDACWVLVHGHDGFSVSLPISRFASAGTLLADRREGEDLRPEQGGPVRLVVSSGNRCGGVKWLRGVEILSKPWPGSLDEPFSS